MKRSVEQRGKMYRGGVWEENVQSLSLCLWDPEFRFPP